MGTRRLCVLVSIGELAKRLATDDAHVCILSKREHSVKRASEVKRKALAGAHAHGDTRFACDGWNFTFTETTGLAGPNATAEC